jgi:hypothetical protein
MTSTFPFSSKLRPSPINPANDLQALYVIVPAIGLAPSPEDVIKIADFTFF